jgi:hypothetical protein
MISIHFFSCDCTGETSPAFNGDNIFQSFLNKQGSFFTILLFVCMMLVPLKINALNLSTMGSFDIRQLNAQKVSLLFPGSTALDVNGHTLLSGNLDVSGILNVSTLNVISLDLTSLNVTGNTLMSGNLDVSGTFTAGTFDVSSLELTSLDVSGNSFMSGNLDVTGISNHS